MENQTGDLLVRHAAHLVNLQGLTQWFYPVIESVFGREVRNKLYEKRNAGPDFMNMDSFLGYRESNDSSRDFIHMNAALKWLHLRSQSVISEEEWQTVVLNNSDLWLESVDGFGLDFMMSRNTTWEYQFKEIIYGGEGLTVIAGLRTNPMVPHYEDWDTVFPEWAPYPLYVLEAGFIPGDFGGRNYEWIVVVIPAVFKNTLQVMLSLEPSSHTHKVEPLQVVEVLEKFGNDNLLMTELALTVPQRFTPETAALSSLTLEAIVSKRLRKFLTDAGTA